MIPYELPQLGYGYAALEPHISARVLELHHGKHHAAYVKGANRAIEQIDNARAKEDFTRIAALERALAFNLSGHVLHTILWESLSPKGGGGPDGELRDAIARDFGSFEAFRRQLNAVAGSIMGSGWAALVWEPLGQRLLISQIYDHQSNLAQGGLPVMVVDAWEHAYYLQYENRKEEHFEHLWELYAWPTIQMRFDAARRMQPTADRR